MLIITGKGDFNLLHHYRPKSFPEFELYLKTDKDCNITKFKSLPAHIKISSVHQPVFVEINQDLKPFDITDPGVIGEASLKSLKSTIAFANTCKIPRIVLHGAFFHESKEAAFELLSLRIKPLPSNIEISFETDARWYKRENALLTSISDFERVLQIFQNRVSITADIEHLILTAVYTYFKDNKDINNPIIDNFENEYRTFLYTHKIQIETKIHEYIEEFFRKFNKNIKHIHLNGSDFMNFFTDSGKTPLLGEHLPLGYKNEIIDRINYKWLSGILNKLQNKHTNIVLEIALRDKYLFIKEMNKSKNHLERYLNISPKSSSMQKCLIIGAGGHGKVIADILELDENIECLGFLDDNKEKQNQTIIKNLKIIGKLSDIEKYSDHAFICSIGNNFIREKIYNDLKSKDKKFINAIHPTAHISKNAELGEGNSICAKSFIGPCSKIGNNCIINTAATIDHDNKIHDHAQIAPGANLGGTVTVGKNSFIGLGSSIIQDKIIGDYALVGAGAVVIKDVKNNTLVVGAPAKPLRELKNDEL